MSIHQEAQIILDQLNHGRWGWMRVKRFEPDVYPTLEERYAALLWHHEQETTFLVDLVRRLSAAVVHAAPDLKDKPV